MTDDCLLPILDQETALITTSPPETPWTSFDLSEVTLEQMLQIDNNQKFKYITPSPSCTATSLDTTNDEQEAESLISFDSCISDLPLTKSTTCLEKLANISLSSSPSTIPTHQPFSNFATTCHLLQPHQFYHSRPEILEMSPEMVAPTDPTQMLSSQSTVLPQRSTTDVIADLKRHLHSSGESTKKLCSAAISSESSILTISIDLTPGAIVADDLKTPELECQDSEDDNHGEDDENEQPTSRPKKVTERKRRLNAIADSWIQAELLNPSKKEKHVPVEEEGDQSTKWLVNQQENRNIVGLAREYQTELFERAKEKNIIAVLDTGLSEVHYQRYQG